MIWSEVPFNKVANPPQTKNSRTTTSLNAKWTLRIAFPVSAAPSAARASLINPRPTTNRIDSLSTHTLPGPETTCIHRRSWLYTTPSASSIFNYYSRPPFIHTRHYSTPPFPLRLAYTTTKPRLLIPPTKNHVRLLPLSLLVHLFNYLYYCFFWLRRFPLAPCASCICCD